MSNFADECSLEPVLFVGTIESNLDPFEEYTKQQLWDVLRLIRMDEFVRNCPLQLQHPVLGMT